MPPGDVMVPAELARPLARLAVTGARAVQERDGGLPLAPGMAGLLAELAMSGSGHAVRSVAPVTPRSPGRWLTVGQAAGLMRLTCRHVRRLARGGRLTARRAGRAWLIDPDSAEDYRKGRARA